MRLLRASDHRRMPWKNGGGMTVEIAVSPEGAGIEDFDWRVSMAFVEQDGPFSIFPGIDRTLAVLSGDGIVLHIAGQDDVTLLSTASRCRSRPMCRRRPASSVARSPISTS